MANDLFRSIKGITGVMELQPGQVNWGTFNPQPYPGAVRAWLWNSFAGGLRFICAYRYRQPLSGSEQYHYGMVGTDGVTPSPGGWSSANLWRKLKPCAKPIIHLRRRQRNTRRTIAILYNKDNEWNSNEGKQTLQWSYGAHLAKYYKAIIAQTIPVDFYIEARDFSAYKVMLLPAYQLVDDELVAKLNQYVHQGGNLILSVRSGTKDRNGKNFEAKWGAKLTPLIGAQISMFDVLPEDMYAQVALNNRLYPWNNWADILKPAAATQVWANYNDQFYKGAAAVTHRTLGKGTVTYIGVDSDDGQIERNYRQTLSIHGAYH